MGVDPVSIPLALLAGVLSFASPCVLPLVPAYIGYIGGASAAELRGGASAATRHRVLLSAALFVVGLATVFTLLGASASALGQVLFDYRPLVSKVAGLLVILFGLYLLGVLRVPFLYRERRLDLLAFRGRGYVGALLMGGAFGLGWTPCVGAILGSILLLASQSQTLWQGMALLFAYALGLGLPFVAVALAIDRSTALLGWLKRSLPHLSAASGGLLVLMGVLVFTERLAAITGWLVQTFGAGLTL